MAMDVREKLIELLKTNACPSPFMCDPACRYYGFGDCFPDRFADYLIANGVTVQENVEISDELLKQLKNAPITICKEEPSIEVVQEWIPVEERLPEDWTDVLVLSRFGFLETAVYTGTPGKWRAGWNGDMLESDSITHWMPLPQPPKGERQ